jgi:hypothetical protein
MRYVTRLITSLMGVPMVTENENLSRGERLQIMLSPEELKAVDDFRFKQRMPSRAAAVRELFRIGLANTGLMVAADEKRKSSDFGVLAPKGNGGKSPDDR